MSSESKIYHKNGLPPGTEYSIFTLNKSLNILRRSAFVDFDSVIVEQRILPFEVSQLKLQIRSVMEGTSH